MKSSTIRSILAWAIKLGTLGFNLSATIGVARQIVLAVTVSNTTGVDVVLTTEQSLLLWLLVVSAVVVVDTVFLASWYELDSNKTQDDSDKLADAITVVIMYLLTILVGVLHGEGLGGLLFRVPMGVAVARSTWKTISYSMRRTGEEGKNKNLPLRVRWEQMKALTAKGVAQVRYELQTYLDDLAARQQVEAAHRDRKKEAGIEAADEVADIYNEQAVLEAKVHAVGLVLPTYSAPSLPASTVTIVEGTATPATTSGSKKYTIEEVNGEWVATCLHPGCNEVIKNGSKDSARRKIVGHGNKHRGTTVNSTPVVSNTNEVVEVVVDPNPEVVADIPADGFR